MQGTLKKRKILREVLRVAAQFRSVLALPSEALLRARRQTTSELTPARIGKLRQPKVAIFVIYQQGGLSESTFITAKHLADSGYDLFAVSNAPLSQLDKEKLKSVSKRVIQRENFGYDFGAYQDVILALWGQLGNIDKLLLINDSVWFPFIQPCGTLNAAENSEYDVAAAQIFGERLIEANQSRRGYPILGSYFLMFNQRALAHQTFRQFWQSYKMSSNKLTTIRRGERALSNVLYQSDLSSGGLYCDRQFLSVVDKLSLKRMRCAVQELVCLSDTTERRRESILNDLETAARSEMARLVLDVAKTKNFIGSSPIISLGEMSTGIVKKNNELLYKGARQRIATAIRTNSLKNSDSVMAQELLQLEEMENRSGSGL